MCVRERVCVCQRDRERVCVSERECVGVRERASLCVSEREREDEVPQKL